MLRAAILRSIFGLALLAGLLALGRPLQAQEPLKEVDTLEELDLPAMGEPLDQTAADSSLNEPQPPEDEALPFGSGLSNDLFEGLEGEGEDGGFGADLQTFGPGAGEEAADSFAACNQPEAEKYRLQRGDELKIAVWPETQLGETLVIRPDGFISFLFAGEVKAEGRSICELQVDITRAVAKYLKTPQISINVSKFREESVYIMGAVNKPGSYEIRNGDTFLKAMSLAGGTTERALKSKVVWLRKKKDSDEMQALILNYSDLLLGRNFPPNMSLQDEDLIYVEEGNKPDWLKIERILTSLFESVSVVNVVNNLDL